MKITLIFFFLFINSSFLFAGKRSHKKIHMRTGVYKHSEPIMAANNDEILEIDPLDDFFSQTIDDGVFQNILIFLENKEKKMVEILSKYLTAKLSVLSHFGTIIRCDSLISIKFRNQHSLYLEEMFSHQNDIKDLLKLYKDDLPSIDKQIFKDPMIVDKLDKILVGALCTMHRKKELCGKEKRLSLVANSFLNQKYKVNEKKGWILKVFAACVPAVGQHIYEDSSYTLCLSILLVDFILCKKIEYIAFKITNPFFKEFKLEDFYSEFEDGIISQFMDQLDLNIDMLFESGGYINFMSNLKIRHGLVLKVLTKSIDYSLFSSIDVMQNYFKSLPIKTTYFKSRLTKESKSKIIQFSSLIAFLNIIKYQEKIFSVDFYKNYKSVISDIVSEEDSKKILERIDLSKFKAKGYEQHPLSLRFKEVILKSQNL